MYKVTLYDRGSYPNNGQVLLDTSSGTNSGIISAVVDTKLNEAGSFTFDISYAHPCYNSASLAPLVGYVSVEDDGKEIFWGRIIAIQNKPISGSKQVSCEGAFSFLLDAELGIHKDAEELTTSAYFTRCINEYNTQIGTDNARNILLGTINIKKKDEKHEYKNTEYTQIQSVLKNKLIDCNDGFIRIRRNNSTKKHYIDWLKTSGRENPQTIELAKNVVDQSSKDSGENVFTMVRAVGGYEGDDLIKLNPTVLSNDMVTQYGKIYKTITFGDAKSTEELQTKLNEYINYLKDRLSITGDIKFVDMHFLQGTATKVLCGDIFTGIVGYSGKRLVAESVSRDLLNPANDKLSLKSEKDLLGKLNSIGANSSASNGTSSGGSHSSMSGSAAHTHKHISETDTTLTLTAQQIEVEAGRLDAVIGDVDLEVTNLSSLAGKASELEGKWTNYEGTAIYQNKDHIAQIAGFFATDSRTGYIKLSEGTKFDITPGGVNSNVGQLVYEHDGSIGNVGNMLLKYEGSYAYQHNDEIGQIVGTYTVTAKQDTEHPYVAIPAPSTDAERALINPSMRGYYELKTGHGSISDVYVKSEDTVYDTKKTYYKANTMVEKVTIDSGGGFEVKRDNSSFGVWDKGELQAGIFSKKGENDTYYTYVKGDNVYLGTIEDYDFTDLKNFAGDAATQSGVFADYLYVKNLTAAEIDSKFAFIGDMSLTGLTVDNEIGEDGVEHDAFIANGLNVGHITLSDDSSEVIRTSGGVYGPHDVIVNGTAQTTTDSDGETVNVKVLSTADINFSKATSLTGAWSGIDAATGDIYAITGTPEQDPKLEKSIGFSGVSSTKHELLMLTFTAQPSAVTNDYTSSNRKKVNVPVAVQRLGSSENPINVYTKTLTNLDASGVYNNGWKAAHYAASVPTEANTQTGEFVVHIPVLAPDNGYDEHTYTINNNNNNITLVQNESGVIVARDAHNHYNEGWGAAQLAFRTKPNRTTPAPGEETAVDNELWVQYPNSTVGGDPVLRRFYVTSTNTSNYAYIRVNSTSGTVVARSAIRRRLSIEDWKNGVISFSANGTGSATSASVNLDAADPVWAENTATVAIYDGDPNNSGKPTGFSVEVNATSRYNAGFNDVSSPSFSSWSTAAVAQAPTSNILSNTITFATDNKIDTGSTPRTGTRTIHLTQSASWSGHKKSVYMRDGSASGLFVGRIEVDATSEFTAGQNDIIDAGGHYPQDGPCTNKVLNQYVTTLTVTNASSGAERDSRINGYAQDSGTTSNVLTAYDTVYKLTSQYIDSSGNWADGGEYLVKTPASAINVAYDGSYVVGQDTLHVIKPVSSGGSSYIPIALDIGTAPSSTSKTRTVSVKVDGAIKSELSETLSDYKNGWNEGRKTGVFYRITDTTGFTKKGSLYAGNCYGVETTTADGNTAHDIKKYWQVQPNQEKTVTCSGDMTVKPDSGYGGLSKVVINYSESGSHSPSISGSDIWTTDRILAGWIEADTLRSKYEQAKRDSEYVAFTVKCGGAEQVYYMEP